MLYKGTSLRSSGQDGSGHFPEHLLLHFLWIGRKPFLKSRLGLLTEQQDELNHDLAVIKYIVFGVLYSSLSLTLVLISQHKITPPTLPG